MTQTAQTWQPPLSFEEKLKKLFVPPSLYIRYKARKEFRSGEKEIALLPFLADGQSIALDIGANKGVWSYLLAQICPEVHAFEPNPKMFSVLKSCAGDTITCHPVALSNQSGQSSLFIPRRKSGSLSNQGGSLSTRISGKDHQEVTVETRRLDEYNFDKIGFIKIDVEGFEMAVLEGAQETLARCRPTLVIELEAHHTGRPLPDLIREVESYGYEAYFLDGNALSKFSMAYNGDPLTKYGTYLFNFIFLPCDRNAAALEI